MTAPSAIEHDDPEPSDNENDNAAGVASDLRRRRMAPQDRRSMILEQAAEFFASNGPAASTRALAKAIGITQALLYRYFPSKEALVRAVYNERFEQRWDPAWGALLGDRTQTLAQRLQNFFIVYIERLSASDYRLWMRAALEGWSFARFYHKDLVEHVLTPIVAELRHETGLPTPQESPVKYSELEIAFTLHGAITFLRIRRDVYGTPMHMDFASVLALNVAVILPGALERIRQVNSPATPSPLDTSPLPS